MRKIVSLALVLTYILGAQAWKYRLAGPIAFSGTVVDENGKPLPNARIDHTGEIPAVLHQTDAQGTFDFQTIAPSVVFRKEGYQSVFTRTDSGILHIVMRDSTPSEFPNCPVTTAVDSIEARGVFFAFPRISGVAPSAQGHDVDYGVRGYFVGNGKDARGVQHGSGPMWSFGLPLDADVWRSVQYQEATYKKNVFIITAARGQFSDGKRWRYLGMFGETADYSDVEPATAGILDKFMDGACWKRAPAK